MKIEIPLKARLHNKFEFELKDARTGEVKQRAYAYNIILNSAIDRASNNALSTYMQGNSKFMRPNSVTQVGGGTEGMRRQKAFGGAIRLGSGVGVLSAARTSLFTDLGYFVTDFYDRGYDWATLTSYYTQKCTLNENTLPNTVITEVGLTMDLDIAYLSTHALLEDSEGTPISLNKGAFDILTVYSTVYMTLEQPTDPNIQFVQGASATNRNWMLDKVYRNMVPYASRIYFGRNDDPIVSTDFCVKTEVTNLAVNATTDLVENKSKWGTYRLAATAGNHIKGIREIGLAMYEYLGYSTAEFNEATGYRPVFRAVFPIAGIWEGHNFVGEELGTGDGTIVTFTTKWDTIRNYTVFVDSVTQTLTTDYTIDTATGVITFVTAPSLDASVTANYSIDYIPKDENHVLDISFSLQFADANTV